MAKFRPAWFLGLLIITAFVLLGAGDGYAEKPIPKDFVFTQVGNDLGPVTFSHQKHLAKKLKCESCHDKIFKQKRGETTGGAPILVADLLQGKYCGVCHNGKVSFVIMECDKCHAPRAAKK